MADKSLDWQCPNPSCINHTKMVFGSKSSCPSCGSTPGQAAGAVKPEPGMPQLMDAPAKDANDWQCINPDCINHTKMVFGRHVSCPSCGTARSAQKPGDWLCPNPSCINNKNCVFGKKPICPNCGSPKPPPKLGGRAMQRSASLPPMLPGNMMMGGCRPQFGMLRPPFQRPLMMPSMQPMGMMPFGAAAAGKGQGKGASDWQCPNTECINHRRMVFGKNATCPSCGSPKVTAPPMMMPQMPQSSGRPGDWQCPNPECQNHRRMVFARHDTCPQCGSDKPEGGAVPHGNPGDWQCPNAECINHTRMVFARKTECPQCGCPREDAARSRSPYR